jgi:hypothetical protein
MEPTERTVPPLPDRDSATSLEEWAAIVCDEPCDDDLLYVVFVDVARRPCEAVIRLRGQPRLPYGRDVGVLERLLREQAATCRARGVALVWQRALESDLDDLAVSTWARGIADRLAGGGLRLHGQVHRSPSGFSPARPLAGELAEHVLPARRLAARGDAQPAPLTP